MDIDIIRMGLNLNAFLVIVIVCFFLLSLFLSLLIYLKVSLWVILTLLIIF